MLGTLVETEVVDRRDDDDWQHGVDLVQGKPCKGGGCSRRRSTDAGTCRQTRCVHLPSSFEVLECCATEARMVELMSVGTPETPLDRPRA